jgi:hypothetical protein
VPVASRASARPPDAVFGKQAGFWLAVAGVSIIAQPLLNLAADRVGDKLPGLRTLNDYTTRRNG